MEFTAMSEREYRALGAEEYEQRRSNILDLATEVPEDATDEQLRAIDEEVTIIYSEDARRSQLAATRNATRVFVENGGGEAIDNVEITKNGGEMPEHRAATLGENFVQYRSEHPSTDNRIIAPAFNVRAAGDPMDTDEFTLTPVEFSREVIGKPAPQLTVLDLFGRRTISAPIYSWNAYVSTEGAAGLTAEGQVKNKLTYTYEPKNATLKKVTGLIKVTEELFADAPYIVDAINIDLVNDLNAARQTIAVADLLATSGIQTDTVTYADATDIFNKIIEAAANVEEDTGIPADAVVVTPALWVVLRAALDAEKRYYAGNPFGRSEYSTLFDMRFVKSANLTANHVLVGAFARGAELVSKTEGIRVDSTNSNDVDFERNLVSVRAECREVLAVKRPACFCDITCTKG